MSIHQLSPREAIAAAQNIKEKEFWMEQFSGEWEASVFPFSGTAPGGTKDEIPFRFSPELSEKLIKLSNGSDYQIYMVLVTTITALLYRYSGKTDIILGAPIYKQKIKAEFINTFLVLRSRFESRITFKDLLLRVRDNLFAAVEHQNFPIKSLINELGIQTSGEEFPLFDTVVLLENIQDANDLNPIRTNATISFLREDNLLKGKVKFNPLRYRSSDMGTIPSHLSRLLGDALGDVDTPLSQLELLSEAEKTLLLAEFNATGGEYPEEQTIHGWFADQAAQTPDNNAVAGVDRGPGNRNSQLCFGELDRRANQLGNLLRAKGVGPDTIVAIMAERSLEMVIGVMGIFKAGGAYLPVDPHYPEERKSYMLKASGARLLLTSGTGAVPGFIPAQMEVIDLDQPGTYSGSGEAPKYLNGPSDLGYLIFTSGSTGKPKGVMIEHKNLVNLLYFNFQYTGIDCGKILQFHTLSFDASFNEIFCTLLCGGQCVLVSEEVRADIPGILSLVAKHQIVTLFLPMSFLRLIFNEEEYIARIPACVRHIQTAGEQVVVNRRFAAFLKENDVFLHNHYGPSETHVVTSLTMDPREDIPELPSIGKPILNTQAYILDREMNLLPQGIPGEVYFSGVQVGRGYLDRPQLTHEKFVDFVHSNKHYRSYKTGDLARWLPDGNIEFLGRIDHQVKIRGFRVEPGEVESRLSEHTDVKEAVVMVGEESSGNKYLCAYIVAVQPVETDRLRDHLSQSLPDYMIPSYFIQLDEIPLTPNGKVDRRALPSIDAALRADVYAAPGTGTEKILCPIWADVLELPEETAGIDDNFFRLGGHSLKATILISKIQKTFEIKILLGDIFKYPTIRELAGYIDDAAGPGSPAIESAVDKDHYTLSSAQKRLYILQQINPGNMSYNMPMTVILSGEPDKARLEKAFLGLIQRHESLRTSFHMIDEEPVQMVHDTVEFSVEKIGPIGPIKDIITGFIRPFDLARAPLMRVGLLKIKADSFIMVADMHHIITDDASMGILAREFMALYAGEELPDVALRYRDYSEWQQDTGMQKILKQQESYWLKKLSGGVPRLNLPIDHPRPAVQGFAGNVLEFELDRDEKDALKSFALQEDSTLFMILLAAFNILLAKLCAQEDIVTGSMISARKHAGLESVVGMFVNTLVFRTLPGGEKTVTQFLKEVRNSTLEAFENRDYPFEDLVEKVEVNRDTGRNPLFDVAFTMRSADAKDIRIPGLRLTPFPFKGNTTKFDLAVIAMEKENGLSAAVEYSTALFNEETIHRFTAYFKKLLRDIPGRAAYAISTIDILPEDEKKRILYDFNDTAAAFPGEKPIHRFFEEQAERASGQCSVVSDPLHLTYGELEQRANRVAHVLQEKGIGPERIVAIKMERSIEMVIGILGILKSGGAYLSIDPGYPPERIDYMLKDSNASILLTASDLEIAHPAGAMNCAPTPPVHPFTPNPGQLAYIIYTSGSTGKPKGVVVEQGSVVNLLTALEKMYPLTGSGAYLLKTSFNFDVSVTELFGWFIGGGRLAILEPGCEKDPAAISAAVARNRITHINFVPSMFSVFLEHLTPGNNNTINSLDYIFVAGEALPADLVRRFGKLNSGIRLENLYGPTEGTVYASGYPLYRWPGGERVPIGKPLANVSLYILDQNGRVLPVGVPGELCISGSGVARGYLNRPQLTGERFSQLNRSYGSFRTYKTGDLARWLPDGDIEYLGRIDHQVKVRGFRVEPGEIENRLSTHDAVTEAVVLAGEDSSGDKYLCAYYAAANHIDAIQLRAYLGQFLPDYMVPSYFIQLDRLPLNPNGKINRQALPPVDPTRSTDNYVEPSTGVEKKLCQLWAEVLKMPAASIGIDDNFFILGGHSLKAAVLTSRIQKAFGIRIILGEIFSHPTIRRLSQYIENAADQEHAAISTAEEKEYYVLSSAQKRLYILQQMEPGNTGYNMPAVFQLDGDIEISRLEKIFPELIDRHESLRTSFHLVNEQPVQKVHNTVEFLIEKTGPIGPIGPIKNIISGFIRPFDLARAPLFRVGLVEPEGSAALLMVDMHHIITDGVSMDILVNEFMQLYGGDTLSLPGLRYRDYAEWQQKSKTSITARKQESYWLKRYAEGVPLLDLPIDHPRPPVQSFAGNRLEFRIGNHEKEALKTGAMTEDATLFMMLLAVFNIFLAKLCSQEEIAVGTMVAARKHADLEPVIGMFVNTLVFTNRPEGDKPFTRFLEDVRNVTLEAFENQEYPFEDLVEKLSVTRDPSRNPLFDAAITMQNQDTDTLRITGPGLKPYPFKNYTTKFDIAAIVTETAGGLTFAIEYCTSLFKEETIHRYITYFKKLLTDIPDQIDKRIADIEILPEEEKTRLLFELNDRENRNAGYPRDKTIHQLFREQAARTPDAIAAAGTGDGWHVSYRQLDEAAGDVARLLREKGIGPGHIVGIMMHPSSRMLASILGILNAGAAYLPLDPDYPGSRIAFMLEDCRAPLLLTESSAIKDHSFTLLQGLGQTGSPAVIQMTGIRPEELTSHHFPQPEPAEDATRDILLTDQHYTIGDHSAVEPAVKPSSPAYVIYTSGSTGKPKGVLISHNNVVRLMKNQRFLFDFGPDDVWTLFHSYCFDFSVWEMYGALLYGGKLLVTPRMTARDPQRFLTLLAAHSVTVLNQTPPAFYHLISEEFRFWEHQLRLRYIIFGGDALHPAKLEKWRSIFPRTRLINMFGITETTVHVTYKEIGEDDIRTGISNIGRPIPTLSTYVMDRNLGLLPLGIPGELCVGGEGVGIGYVNRPELSAEKFTANPYTPGERLYRSGDLVKLTDNGDMEYLGRIDHQVQIRGYRVELGEIRSRLAEHSRVGDADVISYPRGDGNIDLCAYFTLPHGPVETGVLRDHLAEELPGYMIPAYFVPLKEFPLTRNGKIDRKRLPSPDGAGLFSAGAPGTHETPQDPVELKLAEIWCGVLSLETGSIGRDANFFELGGHSLKATIMAARIHSELDVKIPISDIFTTPTIRELAAVIKDAAKNIQAAIVPVEEKEYYPLSPAQKRLYISQHMDWENSGYNIQTVVKLEGELHPERIESVFRKLIDRHESFRTSFHMVNEQPMQVIHDTVDFSIEKIGPIGPIKNIIADFVRPFDLAQAPLMRVGLAKLGDTQHILMMDMHHIITDGTSMAILTNEFMALCGGESLPALKLGYKDFSEWKQCMLRNPEEKERLARQEAYWLERFKDDIPALRLPLDYPRPDVQSFEGDAIFFELDEEQTTALNTLSAEEDVTLYMVFLAVLNILLAKIGDVEDVVIGTPAAGRSHADLEPVIGFFINMLAIRNRPTGKKTFKTLLQEVKTNALNAFDNQDYPLEELVDRLSMKRDSSRHSLFDVVLALQNIDFLPNNAGVIETGGLRLIPYGHEIMQLPFDLALWGNETEGTMRFNLGYRISLFKPETIERLIKNIKEILGDVLQNNDIRLEDITVSHEFLVAAPDNLLEDEGDFGF